MALDGRNGTSQATYCDQTVEITLGPKGAFKKGNLGTLTRRVPADRVISAIPEPRGRPKPPKKPKTPRVVELLQMAMEWQRQLDAGEVETKPQSHDERGSRGLWLLRSLRCCGWRRRSKSRFSQCPVW